MLIFMNTFIIGFIFAIISHTAKCQDTNTLVEINKTYTGSMSEDNSFKFYKIEIPQGQEKDVNNLVIRVQEPEAARVGKINFSDPDIYISKVNLPYLSIKIY